MFELYIKKDSQDIGSMPPAWAARARQPPREEGECPVTVLVTGFGPFLQLYPRNTSWEIASTLPALLPATALYPTPIHVYVHHEAIRVAYHSVTSLIPSLLPPQNPMTPTPDIILHIGLAAGREFYTLEKGAHGRGFGVIPDVDEEKFGDEEAEERWPGKKFPEQLGTGFDTGDVLGRWQQELGYPSRMNSVPVNGVDGEAGHSSKISKESSNGHAQEVLKELNGNGHAERKAPDVRLSPDAGNYMCGFIYYNSLAHYYSLDPSHLPVAFLHVPDLSGSKEKLDTGREVAIALIRALVESRRKVGVPGNGTSNGIAKPEIEKRSGARAGTDVNFSA